MLMAMQAGAPVEAAFLTALAAGDGAAAQALLAPDATIMHDRSGQPEPSTIAALATFLRGCEGRVQLVVPSEDPGRSAFNAIWTCGERGQAEMLLWLENGRIVWVQMMRLAPVTEGAS